MPSLSSPAQAVADRAHLSVGAESFTKLKVLDLFSGIGGFSLGLERTGGFETVAFCEIEDFPRRVLAKHWPDVPCYRDVRELTAERLAADGIAVDVICGGFPCQDISLAGDGAGLDGERSGLWFEYARLIRGLRPSFVLVENVAALLGRGLDAVLGSLASLGYDAEWHCIPASYVGAPHRRDRVWIVAYPQHRGVSIGRGNEDAGEASGRPCGIQGDDAQGLREQAPALVADAYCAGRFEQRPPLAIQAQLAATECSSWWRAEPDVGRVAHGVPGRVGQLKGYGNAVVPQIPELIGRAILSSLGVLSSHRPVKLEGCVNPTAAPLQTIAALGAQARDDLTDQPHRAGFGILTFPAERLIEAHAAEQDWRAA